jgi:hypothetical protein
MAKPKISKGTVSRIEDAEKESGLEHIGSSEYNGIIKVTSTKGFFERPLHMENGNPYNEIDKLVRNVKLLVRRSKEYEIFVCRCKFDLDLTRCSFLGNITDEDVDIELHHTPLTMNDIVEIITHYMLLRGPITSMSVAHEVMQAHFNGYVTVIPMCVTIHQAAEIGKIKCNIRQIYGDLPGFVKKYRSGFQPKHIDKIAEMLLYSLDNKTPKIQEGTLDINLKAIGSKELTLLSDKKRTDHENLRLTLKTISKLIQRVPKEKEVDDEIDQ